MSSQSSFLLNFETELNASLINAPKATLERLSEFYQEIDTFLQTYDNIQKKNVKLFINCIITYIDYISKYSTDNPNDVENIPRFCKIIRCIPNKLSRLKDIFPQAMAIPIFEKLIYATEDFTFANELGLSLNWMLKYSNKELLQNFMNDNMFGLCKLIDTLGIRGDYNYQANILKIIFAMCSTKQIDKYYAKFLFPESLELQTTFYNIGKNMCSQKYIRQFLNIINTVSRNVLSIKCEAISLDHIHVAAPKEEEHELWVDFNMESNTISIECDPESLNALSDDCTESYDSCELITINTVHINNVLITNWLVTDFPTAKGVFMGFNLTKPSTVLYPSSAQAAEAKQLKLAILYSPQLERLFNDILEKMLPRKVQYLSKPPKFNMKQPQRPIFTVGETVKGSRGKVDEGCSQRRANVAMVTQCIPRSWDLGNTQSALGMKQKQRSATGSHIFQLLSVNHDEEIIGEKLLQDDEYASTHLTDFILDYIDLTNENVPESNFKLASQSNSSEETSAHFIATGMHQSDSCYSIPVGMDNNYNAGGKTTSPASSIIVFEEIDRTIAGPKNTNRNKNVPESKLCNNSKKTSTHFIATETIDHQSDSYYSISVGMDDNYDTGGKAISPASSIIEFEELHMTIHESINTNVNKNDKSDSDEQTTDFYSAQNVLTSTMCTANNQHLNPVIVESKGLETLLEIIRIDNLDSSSQIIQNDNLLPHINLQSIPKEANSETVTAQIDDKNIKSPPKEPSVAEENLKHSRIESEQSQVRVNKPNNKQNRCHVIKTKDISYPRIAKLKSVMQTKDISFPKMLKLKSVGNTFNVESSAQNSVFNMEQFHVQEKQQNVDEFQKQSNTNTLDAEQHQKELQMEIIGGIGTENNNTQRIDEDQKQNADKYEISCENEECQQLLEKELVANGPQNKLSVTENQNQSTFDDKQNQLDAGKFQKQLSKNRRSKTCIISVARLPRLAIEKHLSEATDTNITANISDNEIVAGNINNKDVKAQAQIKRQIFDQQEHISIDDCQELKLTANESQKQLEICDELELMDLEVCEIEIHKKPFSNIQKCLDKRDQDIIQHEKQLEIEEYQKELTVQGHQLTTENQNQLKAEDSQKQITSIVSAKTSLNPVVQLRKFDIQKYLLEKEEASDDNDASLEMSSCQSSENNVKSKQHLDRTISTKSIAKQSKIKECYKHICEETLEPIVETISIAKQSKIKECYKQIFVETDEPIVEKLQLEEHQTQLLKTTEQQKQLKPATHKKLLSVAVKATINLNPVVKLVRFDIQKYLKNVKRIKQKQSNIENYQNKYVDNQGQALQKSDKQEKPNVEMQQKQIVDKHQEKKKQKLLIANKKSSDTEVVMNSNKQKQLNVEMCQKQIKRPLAEYEGKENIDRVKKPKLVGRKLYNPNDLSYLSILEENISAQETLKNATRDVCEDPFDKLFSTKEINKHRISETSRRLYTFATILDASRQSLANQSLCSTTSTKKRSRKSSKLKSINKSTDKSNYTDTVLRQQNILAGYESLYSMDESKKHNLSKTTNTSRRKYTKRKEVIKMIDTQPSSSSLSELCIEKERKPKGIQLERLTDTDSSDKMKPNPKINILSNILISSGQPRQPQPEPLVSQVPTVLMQNESSMIVPDDEFDTQSTENIEKIQKFIDSTQYLNVSTSNTAQYVPCDDPIMNGSEHKYSGIASKATSASNKDNQIMSWIATGLSMENTVEVEKKVRASHKQILKLCNTNTEETQSKESIVPANSPDFLTNVSTVSINNSFSEEKIPCTPANTFLNSLYVKDSTEVIEPSSGSDNKSHNILLKKLRRWALTFNIPETAVHSLLNILNIHEVRNRPHLLK